MPSVTEILRYQLDFTTWATERMLTAATELTPEELTHDFKTSDKTILGTLAHDYRAERIWLNRMYGKGLDFRVDGDDTLDSPPNQLAHRTHRLVRLGTLHSPKKAPRAISFIPTSKATPGRSPCGPSCCM